MAVLTFAYGAHRYGSGRYGGSRPATLTASVEATGIPFITGNDRYQIVCCVDTGTSASAPQFRYWYAGPPLWGERLTGDSALPPTFALDEDDDPVVASLELPFKAIKINQAEVIAGVLVEFTPMPASLEDIDATCGFTVRVEGYGLQDYARADGSVSSGVVVSSEFTFAEDQAMQASDPWPNIRTAWCPVRLNIRVASARVIFTNLTLCEIDRIRLIGTQTASRTA